MSRNKLGPSGEEPVPEADRPVVLLTWRIHLAARQPAKAGVAVGCVLFTVVCAHFSLHNPWLTLASGLLLVSSVADFLFPVRYTLTTTGAEVRGLASSHVLAWRSVRRCYQDAEGLKLSPLPRLTRLERFRGVYLRFAGNREEVLAVVQEQLAKHGTHGATGTTA
jgi:hypothetical protein